MPRRTVVSRPFLPEDVELERLERGGVLRSRDRCQRVGLESFEVAGQVGEVHGPSCVRVSGPGIMNPRASIDVEGSSRTRVVDRRGCYAPLAASAIRPKVPLSRMARSARILRSISISARFRPLISWP